MRHVYRFVIKLLSERWPAGRGLFIRNEGGNNKWRFEHILEFKILTIFFQKEKKKKTTLLMDIIERANPLYKYRYRSQKHQIFEIDSYSTDEEK